MRPRRTSLTVAAAVVVVMPVVLLTVGGSVASAHGEHLTRTAGAATGTITCKSFTGIVAFKPPLVPGTATSPSDKETASKSSVSGCTTTPAGGPTSATSVKEKPTKLSSNACSTLEHTSNAGATFTLKWPGGIKPSTVTFTGASQTSSGYSLSGGTVKGSYATTSASANIVIAPSSINAISTCIGGHGGSISSITISGGSMTL
jgi:hypothetical protein